MYTLCSRCALEILALPSPSCEEDIRSTPITQLQRERGRERRTKMNAERDPFILKLPPEIASYIFFLLMGKRDPQDVCQRCTSPPMPFLLGAVCGGWRALARSTPALWSTLVYTSEHNTSLENKKNSPHLIADWLLCSGGLPLTLRISYDPMGEGYNGYIYPTDYDNGWRLIIDTLNLHSER